MIDFSPLIKPIDRLIEDYQGALLIGVSGGGDSLSLAHIVMKRLKNTAQVKFVLLNHNMREGATKEAYLVKEEMARLGVKLHIITNQGETFKNHEMARKWRYQSLYDFALLYDLKALLLGHHLDDQCETILMRLNKQSGFVGLQAMKQQQIYTQNGMRCHPAMMIERPFLYAPKYLIIDYCRENKLNFIDDPSNQNFKYERTNWRNFRHKMAVMGEDAPIQTNDCLKLAKLSEQMTFIRDKMVRCKFNALCEILPGLAVKLDEAQFIELPNYLQKELLSSIIKLVSPQAFHVREKDIINLQTEIYGKAKGGTLKSAAWLSRDGFLYFAREEHKMMKPTQIRLGNHQNHYQWDDRYHLFIQAHTNTENLKIEFGALGPKYGRELAPQFPSLIRSKIPAIFIDDAPFYSPEIDFVNQALQQKLTKIGVKLSLKMKIGANYPFLFLPSHPILRQYVYI